MSTFSMQGFADYIGCTVQDLDDWLQVAPIQTIRDTDDMPCFTDAMAVDMADAIHQWTLTHSTVTRCDVVRLLVELTQPDLPYGKDCDIEDDWWPVVWDAYQDRYSNLDPSPNMYP